MSNLNLPPAVYTHYFLSCRAGMKNSLILFLSASIFYVSDNAYILLSVPFCVPLDLDENRLKEKIRKKKKHF